MLFEKSKGPWMKLPRKTSGVARAKTYIPLLRKEYTFVKGQDTSHWWEQIWGREAAWSWKWGLGAKSAVNAGAQRSKEREAQLARKDDISTTANCGTH